MKDPCQTAFPRPPKVNLTRATNRDLKVKRVHIYYLLDCVDCVDSVEVGTGNSHVTRGHPLPFSGFEKLSYMAKIDNLYNRIQGYTTDDKPFAKCDTPGCYTNETKEKILLFLPHFQPLRCVGVRCQVHRHLFALVWPARESAYFYSPFQINLQLVPRILLLNVCFGPYR